ncbi:MAG: flagellar hook-associated protein FlgK [Planctomycetes bacterium]|nr:flagellar hook-associated protein FlgK [Planctomycetota bacterium]
MALLGPSFQIGRSALAAYQAAIAIVGQNIANVGNPNYTRQSGRLTPLLGGANAGVASPGAGVRMSALNRHIDEALETRLRSSFGSSRNATAVRRALTQVEALFNELTGQDVSTQLSDMFNSFSALQGGPDEITNRNLVLSAADTLIGSLRRQRAELVQFASDLNESTINAAARAGTIADQIAEINQQVVVAEAGSRGASGPLRDRRDTLLRELAGLMDIRTSPQSNGSVNVFVGGEPLVEFNRSRGLTVDTVLENGIQRATVRFADNNGTVIIRDGELAGIREARDENIVEMVRRLDQLANGIIYQVNRVHSGGRGLIGQTNFVGSYDVRDIDAALNSDEAGLPFPIVNGTFIVHLTDSATGRTTTTQIEVDLGADGEGKPRVYRRTGTGDGAALTESLETVAAPPAVLGRRTSSGATRSPRTTRRRSSRR